MGTQPQSWGGKPQDSDLVCLVIFVPSICYVRIVIGMGMSSSSAVPVALVFDDIISTIRFHCAALFDLY
jgi:hypothetical protein